MPALRFLGREWGVSSDDFVFPSVMEELIQFTWLGGLAACFCLIKDSISCDKDDHYIKYFYYGTMGFDAADFIITLAVLAISMRGSIIKERPRRHMWLVLAIKLLIWIGTMVWICLSTHWILVSLTSSCGQTVTWIVKGGLLCSWFVRFIKVVGAAIVLSPWTWPYTRKPFTRPTSLEVGTLHLAVYGHYTVGLWEKRVRKLFCCVSDSRDSHDTFKDVGKLVAEYFDVDLVRSDIVAGMTLVLKQQLDDENAFSEGFIVNPLCNRSSRSSREIRNPGDVPDWMSIPNMAYYMRYAIACYGSLTYFVRNPCSGICRFCCCARCRCGAKSQADNIIDDDQCQSNVEAVKTWTNLRDEDIVYFNMSEEYQDTPFFVAADPHSRNVVVALRGAWSAEEGLPDVGGSAARMTVPGVSDAYCHQSHLERATRIHDKLISMEIIDTAFRKINNEGHLVVTGHSLGSGVAAILAILLRQKYSGVRCYAFSPLGCSVSPDLVKYTEDFICSATVGTDMIARIDMYTLTEFKVKVLRALVESDTPKYQILARGWLKYLYCCCILGSQPDNSDQSLLTSSRGSSRQRIVNEESPLFTHLVGIADELQQAEADLHHVRTSNWPLKLPGRILHIVEAAEDRSCCSDLPAYHTHWVQNSTFDKIMLSSTMLTDHLPGTVLRALDNLTKHEAIPFS